MSEEPGLTTMENESPLTELSTEPDVGPDPNVMRRDQSLEELQVHAETVGFKLDLTIIVSGNLYSGTLCSAATFLDPIAERYMGLPENTVGRSIETTMRDISRDYIDRDTFENPYHFIHLEQAKLFMTFGKAVPTNGVNMRFRVSSIDGWFVGKLSTEDN